MKAPFKYITEYLQWKGYRMTPGRRAVIEVLGKSDTPLTVAELLNSMSRCGLKLNKTTIYRELEFLRDKNLIQAVQFSDLQKRYELTYEGSKHHHHVVCTDCGTIEEIGVVAVEKMLVALEKRLAPKVNFSRVSHNLEFFGQCNSCQKKKKKKYV